MSVDKVFYLLASNKFTQLCEKLKRLLTYRGLSSQNTVNPFLSHSISSIQIPGFRSLQGYFAVFQGAIVVPDVLGL